MEIDLTTMPQGKTYEDQYQGYMDVFKRIAQTQKEEVVHVQSPPWSWVPLLSYLKCHWSEPQFFFNHCKMVYGAMQMQPAMDRTALEVLCSFRPETVDALWKCDMQWLPLRTMAFAPVKEFVVTNNGSFHRKEVLDYMRVLSEYEPPENKVNVVLVPCAADKPYPSPLHSLVLSMLPDDSWYVMNATGVVGLVPQDLWPLMPHYDSGIPNRWRLFEMVKRYFLRHHHARIVVHCDFYGVAIQQALRNIGQLDRATFSVAPHFYYDYVDLMKTDHVDALRAALRTPGPFDHIGRTDGV